jgi:hypothetical protein
VVHLLDSEGDSYETLACLKELSTGFVVRLGQNRNVKNEQDQVCGGLDEVLAKAQVLATRIVELDGHRAGTSYGRGKPARIGRSAQLELRAVKVNISSPRNRLNLKHLPESLEIHVVEALEVNVPHGQEAIRWVLATSESIDSIEAVSGVMELYEMRWLIEEYHKSLKTGCQYEQRQVESTEGLLRLMGLLAPIAQDLLLLRHLSRAYPEGPWQLAVNKIQLKVLKYKVRNVKWTPEPTVAQVCLAIARLGGYIRDAKPPGWLILGRGYQELLTLEAGVRMVITDDDWDV